MVKKSLKNLMMLVLSVSLVIGAVLAGGCVGKEIETPPQPAPPPINEPELPPQETQPQINEPEPPPQEPPTQITQIIEDITPQEAFALIQDNQDNPDFVIIDVRTPEEFAEEYIENAINLDYYSETFQDELDTLDRDKTYLIYCRSGGRSGNALDIMAELDFGEAYNMLGGINGWVAEGLPTIQETPPHISESITPQEVFDLIQDNQDNPDFVIIDIRTPGNFAEEHIEDAINIDYRSENFRDELDKLDKDKTYLIYYTCACGGIDSKTLNMMAELNFSEVYKISGGSDRWKAEGFPTVE